MRPAQVTAQNADAVWEKTYGEALAVSNRAAKYKRGDRVRIDKAQGKFAKSYLPTMTPEVFNVKGTNRTKPTSYVIEDLQKEPILGNFYDENLQQQTLQQKVIDTVHRTRRRGQKIEYLVSWRNENPDDKQWISRYHVLDL